MSATDTILVLLVDDHALVRNGLKRLLEDDPAIHVVGEASDGDAAVRLAQSLQPHVVLMDYALAGMDGVSATRRITELLPGVGVLMLSMYGEEVLVRRAFAAGARGYVLKESPTEDILAAISAVWAGGNYFSAPVSTLVAQAAGSAPQLTGREHEILLLLAHGSSNKVVARQLDISVRTVETHRLSLRRKLGVDSASELLKIAVTNGWTTL